MRCSKPQIVLDELGVGDGIECLFFFPGFSASCECDEDLEPLTQSSRWIGDGGLEGEDRGE